MHPSWRLVTLLCVAECGRKVWLVEVLVFLSGVVATTAAVTAAFEAGETGATTGETTA